MNVNVKLSINDEQRSIMHQNLTGKNTAKMVSRVDVNEFVQGCIAGALAVTDATPEHRESIVTHTPRAEPDWSLVPAKYANKPKSWQAGWLRGRYKQPM